MYVTKYTAQKMKSSTKYFFSKCDQICSFLGIWSHLLKKSLMENFIFHAVIFLSLFCNLYLDLRSSHDNCFQCLQSF